MPYLTDAQLAKIAEVAGIELEYMPSEQTVKVTDGHIISFVGPNEREFRQVDLDKAETDHPAYGL